MSLSSQSLKEGEGERMLGKEEKRRPSAKANFCLNSSGEFGNECYATRNKGFIVEFPRLQLGSFIIEKVLSIYSTLLSHSNLFDNSL